MIKLKTFEWIIGTIVILMFILSGLYGAISHCLSLHIKNSSLAYEAYAKCAVRSSNSASDSSSNCNLVYVEEYNRLQSQSYCGYQ